MTVNMTLETFNERKNRLQEYVEHCAPASEKKTAKATGRCFSSAAPINITVDNSDRRWFSLEGGRTEHHYHAAPAPKSEEDRKNSRDNTAIAVGIAGIIAAAVSIGYTLKRLKETKEDYNRSWEANYDIFDINAAFEDEKHLPNVSRLVTRQSALDQERYRKYFTLAIEATVILAGSAALLAGGLASAPFLITAGIIVTVAGVALALGTLIYYSGSRNEDEVSKSVPEALKELRNLHPRPFSKWEKDEAQTAPVDFNLYIPVGIPASQEEMADYVHSRYAPSAPPADIVVDPDAIPEKL